MSEASYERQHLAIHAAGFINAAGTTIITFGCQLTRTSTGVYGLRLDENNGLVNDESFTTVERKATVAGSVVVEDTDNFFKTIRAFDTTPAALDTALEISVWKSVTH